MITCTFENGQSASLRHVTIDTICVKDNKVLLIKRAAHLSNPNTYALPGGFLSRDEHVAEGALRELREETGYAGTVITLFRINDNPQRKGEDRQNVGFIFLIKVGEKVQESDNEVSEVQWFSLDSLPAEDEFAFDHFQTVELYKKYLQEKVQLPILG